MAVFRNGYGYDDANPKNQIDTYYAGPQLQQSEINWHKDKLDNFAGSTILFSHHQLFSGNARINGKFYVYGSYPYLNKYLLDVFRPYFGNKVAAWLWGHEHNQVLFNDNLFGLPKGRLTGASAFEETPYKLNFPSVPFNENFKVDNSLGYYNHGCAIIDFSTRKNPTDQVKISYYQYPSWGEKIPSPIPEQLIFMTDEYLKVFPQVKGNAISYGQIIYINLENGIDYISTTNYSPMQYYPTVGQKKASFQILGKKNGPIKDGDLVKVKGLASRLGEYCILGAWSTPALYYYKDGYDEQYWYIKKFSSGSDDLIHEGDGLFFINKKYSNEYMCPLIQTLYPNTTSLTTDQKIPTCWFLEPKKT